MTESAITQYITTTFPNVETGKNFGYTFFFYSTERMLPFATLANADNDYDRVSNLDRPGVFRLNIGITKQSFQTLFGPGLVDVTTYDYTALDKIMPHPDYASQNFICVLNPTAPTWEKIREFLAEAHALATQRHAKRKKVDDVNPSNSGSS